MRDPTLQSLLIIQNHHLKSILSDSDFRLVSVAITKIFSNGGRQKGPFWTKKKKSPDFEDPLRVNDVRIPIGFIDENSCP